MTSRLKSVIRNREDRAERDRVENTAEKTELRRKSQEEKARKIESRTQRMVTTLLALKL